MLQDVDSRVTTIEGNVITQGVRDTTGDTPKGNLLLQNAKGETVATVTGLEDYALKDQTVTVDDEGNAVFKVTDRYDPSKSYDVKLDGLVTEASMATANNLTVAADDDNDGNNGNWTITDASKPEGQQKFTNTTLDKAGSTVADGTTANGKVYGKTYTVKDTSGNTIQLIDVASGNVLQNVDSKVGDTNYSSTNYIHNEDNLTTAASILDSNIKATADKVDAGWTATAGGNSIAVNPTETGTTTLNFAGDKNINVTADKASSTINVKLDPTLEVESVTATGSVNVGRTTISSTGLTAGDVKVNAESATVTGLSNTTWNKDYKITTGQAATEDQLQAAVQDINTNSYKGWNVTTNKGTKTAEVASDGNVDFSNNDKNIIVGQDGTNLTFDLNDNITLGDESGTRIQLNGNPQTDSMISITNKDSDTVFNVAKDGTVHSDGDIVAKADSNKKYSLSEVGENAVRYNENKSTVALAGTNGTTITNVADGDVSEGSKEAVNGSQLYATNQKVDAGWVATDGTNKIEVNPTDSGTTTLNFAGDNNITVTADTTNKAIQVALNDKVYLGGDHTEDSHNIVLDGDRGVIGLGSTIALDGRDGKAVIGGVNIDTAYDKATGKPSSTITGLSNTTWDGETDDVSRAATEGQLKSVWDKANTAASSHTEVTVNGGTPAGNAPDYSDGNLQLSQKVDAETGKTTYDVKLNDNITLGKDGNSVQLSGTNGTINAHNSELIFGGTGKYDNVNDMTFNQNGLTITNTQTMRDTGETTTSSTVINGGSIATGNITAGGITVNADNGGTVNGLTNKTWDADNYVSGQAATEDQLKSVSDKVNAGWIATDSQNNEVNITPDNNKLNFAGDENVTVTAANNEIKVALNDDITLKGDSSSIELTGTKGTIQVNQETAEGTNFTNINGNVVSIGYTNSEGIENAIVIDGGKGTITGLSNTTWDDELAKQVANSEELQGTAATQGQLQQAVSEVAEVANAGWNAKAGGNTINVKPNETLNFEGDGNITVSATGGTSNELKFGLNDNITLGDKAGQKTSTSLTLYTDPTLKEVTRIGEDGNPETVKVTGYIPESYIDDQERVDNFISTHGGFMMYATNTSGEGVFGITTDGMVHAKDVISYMPNSDSTSKDKILKYSLNDIGDIVTQIAHGQYDKTGMEYTLISDFSSQADKDKPFQPEEGERTIGLAVREDGAVVVGAVVNEDGYINDSGIRINAEKRVNKDGTTSSDNMATITGLENTTWTPPEPEQSQIATFADDTPKTSRAATESQLNDLYSSVVGYNTYMTKDGSVNIDYGHVTLKGEKKYTVTTDANGVKSYSGGVILDNVAYASGEEGNEAVNVDYLNDAIKDAVKDGPVASNEKHLDTSKTYTPDKTTGKITINEVDGTGAVTGNQLVINDVASKAELDSLKTGVGDRNYNNVTDTTPIANGDSVTTAIGKLNNSIKGVTQDVINNSISGGHVDETGKVVLEKGEGENKSEVTTDIQLTDSEVSGVTLEKDTETGKNVLTITSTDKYDKNKTSSVTVSGLEIASTDDIKDVTGVASSEDLKDAYKDADKDGNATTEYITDSESMVEADVALDHAIQDVAGTSYANDMVLSNRIDSVEKRLGNVEERIDKVGAMAAAIANLRTMGFDPEAPTEIAIGVGQYKSETGIAIGVFHYPNQDFMLSASLSSSGDELMGGIGATWKLGRKSAAERAKDEEARHLEQAEEMKKLAQQEKVKAQAQRHAKLLAERQQASQKNA